MNYTKWLKVAATLQFATALIHTTSLFLEPPPGNETEEQIFDLMSTYRFDLGAGFFRSMSELTLALSSCFSLLFLFGGTLNWYLRKQKLPVSVMKGVITINLVVFFVCFLVMSVFAFLPPIMLSGLTVCFLLFSRVAISKLA